MLPLVLAICLLATCSSQNFDSDYVPYVGGIADNSFADFMEYEAEQEPQPLLLKGHINTPILPGSQKTRS